VTHVDLAGGSLLVANDEHVRDLLDLPVADLLADLLVAVVHLDAEAGSAQLLLVLVGVVVGAVGDRHEAHLLRRHPGRERAGVLLDEVRERPLVAAEARAVDDIRGLLLAVGVDIFHAELLGEQEVDLNGDERVLLAEHVLVLDVELRAVERGLVDADRVLDAEIVEDLAHERLRLVPLLGRALVLVLGVRRIPLGEAERAVLEQANGLKAVFREIQAAAELVLELLRAQDQMALGDRELAHADEAVHFAGVLVAEERRGLAQAHRQVAVAAGAVEEHLILERAGHGTQREAFLRLVLGIAQHEHAVEIVVPVAGDLVELALGHVRRLGEKIAALLLLVLDPALEQLDDAGALRQQNGQALADHVDRGEVLELAADLVVVALAGLFLLGEIRVEFFLFREGDGVDSLKHFALGVAAPVGAAALRQLDGIALDAAGGVEVRARAEVGELTLTVEADDGVLRQVVDELHLIGLLLLLHELDGFLARQLEPLELQLFLADLAHLGFEGIEMLLREIERGVEVVVESVVDRGTDGQLDIRIEALDSLRQHMRAGMPVRLAVLRVFKRVFHFFAHNGPPCSLGRV